MKDLSVKVSRQERKVLWVIKRSPDGIQSGIIGEFLEPRSRQDQNLAKPLLSLFKKGLIEFQAGPVWHAIDDGVTPPHDPGFVIYYRLTEAGREACIYYNLR